MCIRDSSYKEFLDRLVDLATKVGSRETDVEYPKWADSYGRQALCDFFEEKIDLAEVVDRAIRDSKHDSWLGNTMKEKHLRNSIEAELPDDFEDIDALMDLIKEQHEYR